MNHFNLKQERVPHVHRITIDSRIKTTSIEVIDPSDDNLHWHKINSGRTSTDNFAAGHTHIYRGEDTGPPIPVDEA